MNTPTNEKRKQIIKDLIGRLRGGATLSEVLASAREAFSGAEPEEISRVEEELIQEGMPRQEVHRLCDAHLAIMKESLGGEETLAAPGHPIHILMEEHRIMTELGEELKVATVAIRKAGSLSAAAAQVKQLGDIVTHLKDSESHYLREENVLFMFLEKHGVTEPPKVMWTEHDRIRELKKALYLLVDTRESITFPSFASRLAEVGPALAEQLSSHFFKENNILFPMSLRLLSENEWADVREQFDEFGYCCFTPEAAIGLKKKTVLPEKAQLSGVVAFETGSLSSKELELILNSLPVDITFVDKDDTFRYFSQTRERIFPRTRAAIGVKVQQCHPEQSVHAVNQILKEFKKGTRDIAEFWIDLEGRKIHIRYFAVRDENKEYLGCVEVTQDITDIKRIEGQKRLLD